MTQFSHLSEKDVPRMVDVSEKKDTMRTATAEARVRLGDLLFAQLQEHGSTKKGPVLQTAIIGGIQGAKRTSELIPMCHPVSLSGVQVEIALEEGYAVIQAKAKTTGPTGVEMEALTAAATAALTLYDMCKSISKDIVIESIRLLEKTGGKSGDFQASKL